MSTEQPDEVMHAAAAAEEEWTLVKRSVKKSRKVAEKKSRDRSRRDRAHDVKPDGRVLLAHNTHDAVPKPAKPNTKQQHKKVKKSDVATATDPNPVREAKAATMSTDHPAEIHAAAAAEEEWSVEVPSYAMRYLARHSIRPSRSIVRCTRQNHNGINAPTTLTITGPPQAVALVKQSIRENLKFMEKKFRDGSRRDHTWDVKPDGRVLLVHDTHKAVPKPAKPKTKWQHKKAEKVRNRAAEARKQASRQ